MDYLPKGERIADALRSAKKPSDGCGACGDACASNGGTCRVLAENPPAEQPNVSALPDVDALAQLIRVVDGSHSMGAGELAHHIIGWMQLRIANLPQPSAPEPAVDGDTMHRMNMALCEFALRWRLDGDYLWCKACKRPQVAGYASLNFTHAAGCPVLGKAEPKPWQTFVELLSPLYRAPPALRSDDAPRESISAEAVREAWRAAITLGNNICVQESDRENDKDGDIGWINGTAECARRIRDYAEPAAAQFVEMLNEAGARNALAAFSAPSQREAAQEPIGFVEMVNSEWRFGLTSEGRRQQQKLCFGAHVYLHPAPQQREGASESIPLSSLLALLPGPYYMDLPDGGDTPVLEQLRRMAADATRWRLKAESAPLRPVTDEIAGEFHDDLMRRDRMQRRWTTMGPEQRESWRGALESFRSRLVWESAT